MASATLFLLLGNLTSGRQALEVLAYGLVSRADEDLPYVKDVLRVALGGGVRLGECSVPGSEGDTDVFAPKVLPKHGLPAYDGIQRGPPLLTIDEHVLVPACARFVQNAG
jgi:hypothetical protein